MERITYIDVPLEIFESLRNIESLLNNSALEKKLHYLIKLRVSQMNGCAYCVDMHYKELKHLNEEELRLSSLCVWDETPYFTEKERAVLLFAEKLSSINNETIADDIYNSLLKFFNKKEICYLTLAISQINTWNKLMKTFRFTPGVYEVNG